jgi:hypothetical protein
MRRDREQYFEEQSLFERLESSRFHRVIYTFLIVADVAAMWLAAARLSVLFVR